MPTDKTKLTHIRYDRWVEVANVTFADVKRDHIITAVRTKRSEYWRKDNWKRRDLDLS